MGLSRDSVLFSKSNLSVFYKTREEREKKKKRRRKYLYLRSTKLAPYSTVKLVAHTCIATQETEIRRIMVQSQPETLS
jgi:hypothetical protein